MQQAAVAPSARSILDTNWGDGSAFLQHWRQWLAFAKSERPRMLHYVALVRPADLGAMVAGPDLQTRALCETLHHAFGADVPQSGHYRVWLQGGLLQLTLCFGPPESALHELRMQADLVLLRAKTLSGARLWELVGRLCHVGTVLALDANPATQETAPLPPPWQPIGGNQWRYAPTWPLRRSRQQARAVWPEPKRCTVIGAGLCGAATAQALALRGWQVQVLEAGPHPGAGASGVPAGLVSAHRSLDDAPQSVWTTRGAALMRQLAAQALEAGRDWAPSGATTLTPGDEAPAASATWNPQAFWMRPGAWISVCLAGATISLQCHARVAQLVKREGLWCALDATGRLLAQSEVIVLCNAGDGARLLRQPALTCTPALRAMADRLQARYGSVSLGPQVDGLPAHPVHGAGHLLPALADSSGVRWMAGAGFSLRPATDLHAEHRDNIKRVGRMLPSLTDALQGQAAAGKLALWQGERCTSADRLPLIGAVAPAPAADLWVHLAMGSRGLSMAALGAAWLAACIMGEPWPIEARLARFADAQRLGRKQPEAIAPGN